MKRKRSWREKLADSKGLPKVETITGKMTKRWGTGTVVIPAPSEVDALMRKVPKGKLTTINELRELLARQHKASIACPITTGIFAWIAANAAAEDEAEGKKRITPYWRTLKSGGELNPKYPGGIEEQRVRLEAEGHRVVVKGKRSFVADFQKRVVGARPAKSNKARITVDKFRQLALSLPETCEQQHMDHPDFRVGGKIFATLMPDRESGMVKLTPQQQKVLVQAEPAVFEPCSGAWGRSGCTKVHLNRVSAATLRAALEEAWRNTAPARLNKALTKRVRP
jgi:hypothetical protein